MYEPVLPDPVTAEVIPAPVEPARAVFPTGASDARSLTLVYAPVTVTHHHAPALAPNVHNASVWRLATSTTEVIAAPTPLPRRRFTLPELCLYLGMAVTGSSVVAVALSIVAGESTFLLGAPAALGAATILGSAAAINRTER